VEKNIFTTQSINREEKNMTEHSVHMAANQPMATVAWLAPAKEAPSLRVSHRPGLSAWLPHNDDQGLGCGQGSTDGVLSTFYRGGFHRRQLPEPSRALRRQFNLRGYRGSNSCKNDPYACHYDPEPFFDEADSENRVGVRGTRGVWSSLHPHPQLLSSQKQQVKGSGLTIWLALTAVGIAAFAFSKKQG
jgi:hypothetical protein